MLITHEMITRIELDNEEVIRIYPVSADFLVVDSNSSNSITREQAIELCSALKKWIEQDANS